MKFVIRLILDFGWRESEGGLILIFFEGLLVLDFFIRLCLLCRGKLICVRNCVCSRKNCFV